MTNSAETTTERCDVAVIGGGPAGSTAAALLARRGYRGIALGKARHPRFHIAESLLPMNLPIFHRLGVLANPRPLSPFHPAPHSPPANAPRHNPPPFSPPP